MIPEDSDGPFCRIFGQTIFQKFQQTFFCSHGRPAPVRDRFKISVTDGDKTAGAAFDLVIIPFLCAACQDHDVYVITVLCEAHLIDILAGAALQI